MIRADISLLRAFIGTRRITGDPDRDNKVRLAPTGAGWGSSMFSRVETRQRVVLVVEDEVAIGLALAGALTDAGYVVAGPIATTADALDWLQRTTPDLALVDVMLRDGPCIGLARELRRRGVPFLINSGHVQRGWAEPELADAPWLEKPNRYDDLVAGLHALKTMPAPLPH